MIRFYRMLKFIFRQEEIQLLFPSSWHVPEWNCHYTSDKNFELRRQFWMIVLLLYYPKLYSQSEIFITNVMTIPQTSIACQLVFHKSNEFCINAESDTNILFVQNNSFLCSSGEIKYFDARVTDLTEGLLYIQEKIWVRGFFLLPIEEIRPFANFSKNM